ncbi:MAG: D-mannonate dehydratase [Spirochaetales bacterium]|nr:D-mannonate dehydratase [Spirochaetales bacterium]
MSENCDSIHLGVKISPRPTDEDLRFASQLGVEYVYTWQKEEQIDIDYLVELKRKVESFGLVLYNVGAAGLGKNDKIHLALPGRDEAIERFAAFIRNLGKAGIGTTTFTWEQAGVRSTKKEPTRGGAIARAVNMDVLAQEPPSHPGVFTDDDMWENFAYFMSRIIPVAEAAGVRLALHPNDPPVPSIGGIPCLIHSFESYKRAFEIGDSDSLGMEFCTGCWLEGGEKFGDILAGIRYFVERKKVFIVHFRNVSSPLPHFVESFLDDGYMDMAKVMQTFCNAGYDGSLILDHTPLMAGSTDDRTPTAYAIGYIKGLMRQDRKSSQS